MKSIEIDSKILNICPKTRIAVITADVVNSDTCDALWQEIEEAADEIKAKYQLLEINKRPAIAATHLLYKRLGKDPGRYRVASEALCRRIIRELGLYRLTSLIDIVNLVSITSGYPISGLDYDKISGDILRLGVGMKDEEYHGIGRGLLNIEGMPVYRDDIGPIATPTSDEERTKFMPDTRRVQININAFAPEMPLAEAVDYTTELLVKYAHATNLEAKIF